MMNFIDHKQYTTHLVHRSVTNQIKQQHQKTANSKTRSEVRGGGRKPWKQKGTGKARSGSIRSPLWRGGGVIFGPKPINILYKLNIKEKRLALRTLLQNKYTHISVQAEDHFNINQPKTQFLCKQLNLINTKIYDTILLVVNKKNKNLYLASRNLKNVNVIQASQLNIISVLSADKIYITKEALLTIQEIYHA